MMRLWVSAKSAKDILSLALCLVSITMFPSLIREWCLAGTEWAEIHSLLTLLVGAEGKCTARVWLCESTARLAEAARWTQMTHISGPAQSNKQGDSLLSQFMGHKPIVKPDPEAYPNREAGERKCLIGRETRAELVHGNKTALSSDGLG